MRGITLTGLLLTLLSTAIAAQVIRVPKQYPTIQQALFAATPGTTILVDPGTYQESLAWPATDGIRLIAAEGPEVTVLRTRWPTLPVVAFSAGLSRATLLQGFRIKGGVPGAMAPAVFVGSSPTVRFNVIEDNMSHDQGSGMLVAGAGSPLIDRNVIRNNLSYAWGGGIFVGWGSSPVIRGNQILDNQAWNYSGGGIFVQFDAGHSVKIVGNLIARNEALVAEGDGVAFAGGSVDFFNNTVADSGGVGAAVYLRGGGAPSVHRLFNNIIASNGPTAILALGPNLTVHLDFNDVWNQRDAYVGVTPGVHDLSLDPQFAGIYDYHLSPGSPMIDAGANLPTGDQIGLDLDGDPRFVDSTLTGRVARSDIGADEFNLARLGLTGVPWPGNSLRFQVEGWYGARFLLSWSPSPASTLIQPYGHLLLGQPFVLAAGIVPRAIEVKVPAAPSLVGFDVFFQALVLTTYGTPPLPGAFTNRVDLTIGTRR